MALPAMLCVALAWQAAPSDRLRIAPSHYGFPSWNTFPVSTISARAARADAFPSTLNLQVFYGSGIGPLNPGTSTTSFVTMGG